MLLFRAAYCGLFSCMPSNIRALSKSGHWPCCVAAAAAAASAPFACPAIDGFCTHWCKALRFSRVSRDSGMVAIAPSIADCKRRVYSLSSPLLSRLHICRRVAAAISSSARSRSRSEGGRILNKDDWRTWSLAVIIGCDNNRKISHTSLKSTHPSYQVQSTLVMTARVETIAAHYGIASHHWCETRKKQTTQRN